MSRASTILESVNSQNESRFTKAVKHVARRYGDAALPFVAAGVTSPIGGTGVFLTHHVNKAHRAGFHLRRHQLHKELSRDQSLSDRDREHHAKAALVHKNKYSKLIDTIGD